MLHGDIKINDVSFGTWQAVRGEKVFEGMYEYDCEVEYRNLEGYLKRVNFPVKHYEKMGALTLTSMVLSTAMRKMRP